uniref:ADP-ribosylation factor GTPase-activating protein n=1 Tax=Coccidioides posadasii RMSCC 3488 TaxID=454284 RepID=A0A0J6FLI8_COCPO|nr:centaurin-beta-2 [Coccidioides posadasii RMSCC 3488]
MGNISSRPDDPAALYLKDQTKLTIASLTITNYRGHAILHIGPNGFPATRVMAKRDTGDDTPIEFVLDPDSTTTSQPSFLLRLSNEDELTFKFSFIIRQTQIPPVTTSTINGVASTLPEAIDTTLKGVTFAHASNSKELDNLITREFHANPNLQNNSNVQHVGTFSTEGSPSIQFDWSWKWKPPKRAEDRGGGWRNCCSFLDYDERTNRLNTLATFTFWVQNATRPLSSPVVLSPRLELAVPPRNRTVSSQSVMSKGSELEALGDVPQSPIETESLLGGAAPAVPVKLDICQRPGEDMSAVEDGPLFRATMKALEQKTGNMRTKMKKLLKKAEAVHQRQVAYNESVSAFIIALNEASTSNANAIQPALEHYFDKIAKEILIWEQQNSTNLQKLIIDPLTRLYNNDIKQAESKKKDFEDESRDYYAYVGRYLGQRQDSLKEKKRAESDSKYQTKRRNFELKRFDYSSFMQDLHGGRKEQEVLSHLTKYADIQARSYLSTAKKVEEMLPQLQALIHEVSEVDKEFQFQRTEREEKRRALEQSTKKYIEPEGVQNSSAPPTTPNTAPCTSDSELGRADSTGSQARGPVSNRGSFSSSSNTTAAAMTPSGQNRFKGIRDLEERDHSNTSMDKANMQQKKEGLLWALSRPGSHIDPKGINKQAWHKFWIVLDQGKLSEYSNWKQKLDLHMDPIDLRMASVREARNAERRFCFEVITPQFKRIYQATSEEDMGNWIMAINNALQSAVESGRGVPPPPTSDGGSRKDIGSALMGKTTSSSNTSNVSRRTTVGARPSYVRNDSSYEDNPSKLLQVIREADQGNNWCADCNSASKVEWVSINLGIVLCIECSGIHRSLGTHISKIRSLTLDIHSFSNDIVEILLQIGNRVSNMIWEATLNPTHKPTAQSSRDQRLKFITAKYSERAFVRPLSSTLSRYGTADETLLASIKQNDIQGVLYGIALRASPNATDRSRNTHAVFLALAAADPASPSQSMTSISTWTKSAPQPPTGIKAIPFPIAELLVQNGADIPAEMPAIPLSPAAQLYVNQRTGRALGSGNPTASPGGDTLSALPTIRDFGSGGNGLMPSPAEMNNKERERLHKRGSAGARFAGKATSFGS